MADRSPAILSCALLALIACDTDPLGAETADAAGGQQGADEAVEEDGMPGEGADDPAFDPAEQGPGGPSELSPDLDEKHAIVFAPAPGEKRSDAPQGVYWIAMHAGTSFASDNELLADAVGVFDRYFAVGPHTTQSGVTFTGMGPGGTQGRTALSFATWYMSETTGPEGQASPGWDTKGWNYKPGAKFEAMLAAAALRKRPIVVHLNGTRYMEADFGPCTDTSLWCQFEKDKNIGTSELQRDQYGQPFAGNPGYGGMCEPGHCYLTLARGASNSPLGTRYRRYKQRNLTQAIARLRSWAAENPGLLIGISLDSETGMGAVGVNGQPHPRIGDYSLPAVLQYRKKQEADLQTVGAFNDKFKTCHPPIQSWNDVVPPMDLGQVDLTSLTNTTPCWIEWQNFRRKMVVQMVGDTGTWAVEAGMPADRVFGHQSVNNDLHFFWFEASPVETAAAGPGMPGFDLYEQQLFKPDGNGGMKWEIGVFEQVQQWGKYWALAEFSAGLGPDATLGKAVVTGQGGQNVDVKCKSANYKEIYDRTFYTLHRAYLSNNRIVMPFLWNPIPWDPNKAPDKQSALVSWGIGECNPAMDAYRSYLYHREKNLEVK